MICECEYRMGAMMHTLMRSRQVRDMLGSGDLEWVQEGLPISREESR
jgi:hypothetical protein